jgi:hypothetical protein
MLWWVGFIAVIKLDGNRNNISYYS